MGKNEIYLALQEINTGFAIFVRLYKVDMPAGNLIAVWIQNHLTFLLQTQHKELLISGSKKSLEWEESLKHSFEERSKEISLKIWHSQSTTRQFRSFPMKEGGEMGAT